MNHILKNVHQIPAIFTFNSGLNKEYQPLIYDLIRMTIIHTMINILSYAANPSENELFGNNYFSILCFILIGVATYWLIVNKIIRFEFNSDSDVDEYDEVVEMNENTNVNNSNLNNVEPTPAVQFINEIDQENGGNIMPNDENVNNNASVE